MLAVERRHRRRGRLHDRRRRRQTAFLLSDEGPGWIEEQGLAARFLAEDGEVVDVALAG